MLNLCDIIGKSTEYLKQKLDDFWSVRGRYDFVYVSLGSKWNEDYVRFSQPKNIRAHKFKTNAPYQMIPNFLRSREKRSLVIIIDRFYEETNKAKNKDILIQSLEESNDKIDAVLLGNLSSNAQLNAMIYTIVNKVVLEKVEPDHFMICNYIKFQNDQVLLHGDKEQAIYNLLKSQENKKYGDCLYVWFGYLYQFYDYIYRYNYFNKIEDKIETPNQLDGFFSNVIAMSSNNTIVVQSANIISMCDNILDIKLPDYNQTGMTSTIKEYLVDNDMIDISMIMDDV